MSYVPYVVWVFSQCNLSFMPDLNRDTRKKIDKTWISIVLDRNSSEGSGVAR